MSGFSGKTSLTRQGAEEIAIDALYFLANDFDQMSRFMELTGMTPDYIASYATSSTLQVALLEFLMGNEALLLTFCSSTNINPKLIAPAHQILGE